MNGTVSKLRLEDVSFSYNPGTPLEVRAVEHITLDLEAGKITGIAGHTGSGKSTLLRMLNGLEKPTSGRVLLDGKDIWAEPKKIGAVRFRVGLVMQYPEYQLFEETVRKDIAYGPARMKLSAEEIGQRVRESAAVVGLSDAELDASPFELSGGQKRRAAIAGIMAMRPEVLVLDEPAAGLDPEGREVIFSAVRRYQTEQNATVVIVSHSMENMTEYCDRIAVLKHGTLELCGTREEVFSDPKRLRDAGLEVPEITELAENLAAVGMPLDRSVFSVEGAADALCRRFAARKGGAL